MSRSSAFSSPNPFVSSSRTPRTLDEPLLFNEDYGSLTRWHEFHRSAGSTTIQRVQLRKEHVTPFHEFVMVLTEAGYMYRVDRGREGPVLDTLRKDGVPPVDTIALLRLTSLEDLDETSYCAIELRWGSNERHKTVRLKLVLDICFHIHNNSGKRYKLLTYNCYFFAQTIIVIVARKAVVCKLDEALEDMLEINTGMLWDVTWNATMTVITQAVLKLRQSDYGRKLQSQLRMQSEMQNLQSKQWTIGSWWKRLQRPGQALDRELEQALDRELDRALNQALDRELDQELDHELDQMWERASEWEQERAWVGKPACVPALVPQLEQALKLALKQALQQEPEPEPGRALMNMAGMNIQQGVWWVQVRERVQAWVWEQMREWVRMRALMQTLKRALKSSQRIDLDLDLDLVQVHERAQELAQELVRKPKLVQELRLGEGWEGAWKQMWMWEEWEWESDWGREWEWEWKQERERKQSLGELWDSIEGELRQQLRQQLEGELEKQLELSLGERLGERLGGSLGKRLGEQMGNQLGNHLGNHLAEKLEWGFVLYLMLLQLQQWITQPGRSLQEQFHHLCRLDLVLSQKALGEVLQVGLIGELEPGWHVYRRYPEIMVAAQADASDQSGMWACWLIENLSRIVIHELQQEPLLGCSFSRFFEFPASFSALSKINANAHNVALEKYEDLENYMKGLIERHVELVPPGLGSREDLRAEILNGMTATWHLVSPQFQNKWRRRRSY